MPTRRDMASRTGYDASNLGEVVTEVS